MLSRTSRRVLSLAFLLLLNGCAFMSSPGLDEQFKPSGNRVEGDEIYQREIDALLASQSPLKALELLQKKQSGGLPEPIFTDRYISALKMALQQAELAKGNGAYREAGLLYRGMYDYYPAAAGVAEKFNFSRSELSDHIKLCADQTFDKGLKLYRSGDLHQAIETWVQIEQFQPSHSASEKAIHTTRTQIRNLEEIIRDTE